VPADGRQADSWSYAWKVHICVRVSRFWDFYDPQDETRLLHSDLVLIDEEVRIVSCLPVHRSVYFYYGS
jgi:hypothetical protein